MPKGKYPRTKRWTKYDEKEARRAVYLYDTVGLRIARVSEALGISRPSVVRLLRGEVYPGISSKLFDGTRLNHGHWKSADKRVDE